METKQRLDKWKQGSEVQNRIACDSCIKDSWLVVDRLQVNVCVNSEPFYHALQLCSGLCNSVCKNLELSVYMFRKSSRVVSLLMRA